MTSLFFFFCSLRRNRENTSASHFPQQVIQYSSLYCTVTIITNGILFIDSKGGGIERNLSLMFVGYQHISVKALFCYCDKSIDSIAIRNNEETGMHVQMSQRRRILINTWLNKAHFVENHLFSQIHISLSIFQNS